MGTRGTFGFKLNGKMIMSYNHFDSYPDDLGEKIAEFVADHQAEGDWARVASGVETLTLVNAWETPSPRTAAKFSHLHNHGVSTGSDWYSILREAQGDLDASLSAGIMTCHGENWNDEEFAYVVNLDRGMLEFYDHGRYKKACTFASIQKGKRPWPVPVRNQSRRYGGY